MTVDVDVTTTEFLSTYAWRSLRMEAILKYGRKCMCCNANGDDGKTIINVDHIKPRKTHPELALDINNLQILCDECNHGKGNKHETDWRKPEDQIPCEPKITHTKQVPENHHSTFLKKPKKQKPQHNNNKRNNNNNKNRNIKPKQKTRQQYEYDSKLKKNEEIKKQANATVPLKTFENKDHSLWYNDGTNSYYTNNPERGWTVGRLVVN